MRIGERATLDLEGIVFRERCVAVTIGAGQGDKARSAPLNACARQVLAAYQGPLLGVGSSISAEMLASRIDQISLGACAE
jgi:site-specific recombinase XerD